MCEKSGFSGVIPEVSILSLQSPLPTSRRRRRRSSSPRTDHVQPRAMRRRVVPGRRTRREQRGVVVIPRGSFRIGRVWQPASKSVGPVPPAPPAACATPPSSTPSPRSKPTAACASRLATSSSPSPDQFPVPLPATLKGPRELERGTGFLTRPAPRHHGSIKLRARQPITLRGAAHSWKPTRACACFLISSRSSVSSSAITRHGTLNRKNRSSARKVTPP